MSENEHGFPKVFMMQIARIRRYQIYHELPHKFPSHSVEKRHGVNGSAHPTLSLVGAFGKPEPFLVDVIAGQTPWHNPRHHGTRYGDFEGQPVTGEIISHWDSEKKNRLYQSRRKCLVNYSVCDPKPNRDPELLINIELRYRVTDRARKFWNQEKNGGCRGAKRGEITCDSEKKRLLDCIRQFYEHGQRHDTPSDKPAENKLSCRDHEGEE